MGHNYVRTEHVRLGLIEQEGGEGILTGLGLELDATRNEVKRLLTHW
jgi:ATP-dependent Clp protease ATP-binding subunit ClpA